MLPDYSRVIGPMLTALGKPDASLAAIARSLLQHRCLLSPPRANTASELGAGGEQDPWPQGTSNS